MADNDLHKDTLKVGDSEFPIEGLTQEGYQNLLLAQENMELRKKNERLQRDIVAARHQNTLDTRDLAKAFRERDPFEIRDRRMTLVLMRELILAQAESTGTTNAVKERLRRAETTIYGTELPSWEDNE